MKYFMSEDLYRAILKDDVKEVARLLKDKTGKTVSVQSYPLHLARSVPMMELLLKNKEDPEAVDSYEQTPLNKALFQEKSFDVVKFLVEKGANINTQDKFGYTPLHWALVTHRPIEEVQFLIDHGADFEAKDFEDKTPLFKAVEEENAEAVQLLLHRGASVVVRDLYSNSPLHVAMKDKETPETVQVVCMLLRSLANSNAVNERTEESPLSLAVKKDLVKTVRVLMTYGGNPNHIPHIPKIYSHSEKPFEHNVTDLMQAKSFEMVKLLLKYNADVNAVTSHGKTPLHYLVRLHDPRIVSLLLDKGADINMPAAPDSFGDAFSPLDEAIKSKAPVEFVKFLMEKGATPSSLTESLCRNFGDYDTFKALKDSSLLLKGIQSVQKRFYQRDIERALQPKQERRVYKIISKERED